jgi:hypothetical protein
MSLRDFDRWIEHGGVEPPSPGQVASAITIEELRPFDQAPHDAADRGVPGHQRLKCCARLLPLVSSQCSLADSVDHQGASASGQRASLCHPDLANRGGLVLLDDGLPCTGITGKLSRGVWCVNETLSATHATPCARRGASPMERVAGGLRWDKSHIAWLPTTHDPTHRACCFGKSLVACVQ